MKDPHKTVVIFRKVPGNYSGAGEEIIALFPEIPAMANSYAIQGALSWTLWIISQEMVKSPKNWQTE